MSAAQPSRVEPNLSQFEVERWSFPSDEDRDDYKAALEELREFARERGIEEIHARLVGQPTAAELRSMLRVLSKTREIRTPQG